MRSAVTAWKIRLLDAAEVVTLDRIQVPEQDNLPPLRELVAKAHGEPARTSRWPRSTTRRRRSQRWEPPMACLPSLQGVASVSASGLAGTSSPQFRRHAGLAYYVGGLGTPWARCFATISRTSAPRSSFQATLRNHVAQGDYGIDQLQLRQGDLIERRNLNQVVVDISNQMVALRQARSRYSQAVDTRKLQEELLEKSQQSFSFGAAPASVTLWRRRLRWWPRRRRKSQRCRLTATRASRWIRCWDKRLEVNHVSVDQALKER